MGPVAESAHRWLLTADQFPAHVLRSRANWTRDKMKNIIMWSTTALLGLAIVTGCSDDESACVGPTCSDPQPCTGAACEDMASDMKTNDLDADVSTLDLGQDATQDMASLDVGADMMADAQMDMDPVFPPAAKSTLFQTDVPFIFRDADRLAGGVIAVGTTPDNFIANESREAVAVHYDSTGVVWSARFGDPSNDQFTSVARRGNEVLLGGLSRGYSVGAANNNDVLLVRANATGFGEAFNWGTTGEELLYGLFDGGQVAQWIGVGESGNGENRDGLVVAFDANLQVLWATKFETGDDEIFFDGAVAGNQIVVVGNTGVKNGTRRSLVASVSNGAVAWARRSTADNTDATSAVREGNQVLVAGKASSANGSQPAIMSFAADGSVSGVRFDTAGMATNILVGDQRNAIVGYGANRAGMLITWDGNTAQKLPLETQLRAAFLSNPLFEAGGQNRTVFQSAGDSFVDLPFSLTPQSSCSSTVEELNINSVGPADFEQITLTPTSLSFTGGAITAPRITMMTTSKTDMVCQP